MRDFQLPGRSTVHAARGMCATSHPMAAQAAIDVMREGGNAIDAAVTASLLLGLVEPAMTGIGGDAFALIWKEGASAPIGLNGSGRAPEALTAAMLRNDGMDAVPLDSPHAVTVPGAVDAFDTLLREHGSIDWRRALAPSLRVAREGHPVAPKVAWDWARNEDKLKGDARRHFLRDGKAPRAGEFMRYEAQADALEAIAEQGRAGFYEGPVAQDMVDSLNAMGGTHTMADFAKVACNWVEPIHTSYRDTVLWELPPNGQGIIAMLMCKILEGYDLASLDPLGPERAHLEAEAARLAYDIRNRLLADADTPGAAERSAYMLDPRTVETLRARIDPATRDPDLLAEQETLFALGPNGAPLTPGGAAHRDTIYLTAVDSDRTVVSLIYSVFHAFGSGLASSRYGINFHNRGAGFALAEGHPNELGPGKRPMHTIIPAMIAKDGRPWISFGVMGGQYQPNGHARFVSNVVDYGLDVQEALDAPRSFYEYEHGHLDVERGYSRATLDRLGAMGHDAVVAEAPIGGGQAIEIDYANGGLIGGSDPRKDGCALGY